MQADWTDVVFRPDLNQGPGDSSSLAPPDRGVPGPVQAKAERSVAENAAQPGPESVQRAAAGGIASGGQPMPHGESIQRSFGSHDISHVTAHVGGAATDACNAMGAAAYATGTHVAFRDPPDLHTAAHEAAHVVQQHAGVNLAGGVGREGDSYERQADAAADAVVAGRSAEALLGAAGSGTATGVQMKPCSDGPVQMTKYRNASNGTTISFTDSSKAFTKHSGSSVDMSRYGFVDPALPSTDGSTSYFPGRWGADEIMNAVADAYGHITSWNNVNGHVEEGSAQGTAGGITVVITVRRYISNPTSIVSAYPTRGQHGMITLGAMTAPSMMPGTYPGSTGYGGHGGGMSYYATPASVPGVGGYGGGMPATGYGGGMPATGYGGGMPSMGYGGYGYGMPATGYGGYGGGMPSTGYGGYGYGMPATGYGGYGYGMTTTGGYGGGQPPHGPATTPVSAPPTEEQKRAPLIAQKLTEYEQWKGQRTSQSASDNLQYLGKLDPELQELAYYNSTTLDMVPTETFKEIKALIAHYKKVEQDEQESAAMRVDNSTTSEPVTDPSTSNEGGGEWLRANRTGSSPIEDDSMSVQVLPPGPGKTFKKQKLPERRPMITEFEAVTMGGRMVLTEEELEEERQQQLGDELWEWSMKEDMT